MGLCGVYFNAGKTCADGANPGGNPGTDYSKCFSWSTNGLTMKAGGEDCKTCFGAKWTCENKGQSFAGGCQDGTPVRTSATITSLSFDRKCGEVQQIDVSCGTFHEFRSYISGPCTNPSASPTASPLSSGLSCTSLTKNVAAPTIGSVVTLTCAGTVTPPGTTTLSYKFRYNVNGGAWIPLTNTTTTTSQLTPNACGSYVAQCQACGTINGSLVCDPNWVAATAD
jgi:hypothetical protein